MNHPWTTGLQLAYKTEAVLWGAFLEQRVEELSEGDGTITVAALIMNSVDQLGRPHRAVG